MDAWWIGTVSALAGAVTGAVLQAWRDTVLYRRQMRTRWDEPLLDGLADYLAAADRAVRALLRWRQVRAEGQADAAQSAADAVSTFESLHEKSNLVTLLTGDRDDAVRAAARGMREALLPLRDEVLGMRRLADADVQSLVSRHRDARTHLIAAAQARLGVATRAPR